MSRSNSGRSRTSRKSEDDEERQDGGESSGGIVSGNIYTEIDGTTTAASEANVYEDLDAVKYSAAAAGTCIFKFLPRCGYNSIQINKSIFQ